MGNPIPRGFSVQTRCASVEDFVDRYFDRVGPKTILVNTVDERFVGRECGFAILLSDKRPVMAGTCVVVEVFRDANNPWKRTGMQLAIKRLGAESQRVFALLEAKKSQTTPAVVPPAPAATTTPRRPTTPLRVTTDLGLVGEPKPRHATQRIVHIPPPQEPTLTRTPRATSIPPQPRPATATPAHVVAEGSRETRTETRTPGSSFVLPANPLSNLTDASLEGFVDCRLFDTSSGIVVREPAAEAPGGLVPIGEPVVESLANEIVEPPAPVVAVPEIHQVPVVAVSEINRPVPVAVPEIDEPAFIVSRPPVEPGPPERVAVRTTWRRKKRMWLAAALVGVAFAATATNVVRGDAAKAPAIELDHSSEQIVMETRTTERADPPPPAPPRRPTTKLHAVLVTSFPVGAHVVVNGRSFGTTPTYVKVPANVPVDVHITRRGFAPVVHEVTSTRPNHRVFAKLRKL